MLELIVLKCALFEDRKQNRFIDAKGLETFSPQNISCFSLLQNSKFLHFCNKFTFPHKLFKKLFMANILATAMKEHNRRSSHKKFDFVQFGIWNIFRKKFFFLSKCGPQIHIMH